MYSEHVGTSIEWFMIIKTYLKIRQSTTSLNQDPKPDTLLLTVTFAYVFNT